jgi:XTP/dITP diphosphohydrolase
MSKLILAGNNAGKIAEIKAVLGGDYQILSLKEAGLAVEPAETGTTFFANALIKAKAVFLAAGCPVLADDSGLLVDALDGAPGVRSARYAPDGTDFANNQRLLAELAEKTDRRARFVTVLVYYDGKKLVSASGETAGEILTAYRGTNGFGYDPLFYSYELARSFGEADAADKNRVSHRARALRALHTLLCG